MMVVKVETIFSGGSSNELSKGVGASRERCSKSSQRLLQSIYLIVLRLTLLGMMVSMQCEVV